MHGSACLAVGASQRAWAWRKRSATALRRSIALSTSHQRRRAAQRGRMELGRAGEKDPPSATAAERRIGSARSRCPLSCRRLGLEAPLHSALCVELCSVEHRSPGVPQPRLAVCCRPDRVRHWHGARGSAVGVQGSPWCLATTGARRDHDFMVSVRASGPASSRANRSSSFPSNRWRCA